MSASDNTSILVGERGQSGAAEQVRRIPQQRYGALGNEVTERRGDQLDLNAA
jgi:hypothetical protein